MARKTERISPKNPIEITDARREKILACQKSLQFLHSGQTRLEEDARELTINVVYKDCHPKSTKELKEIMHVQSKESGTMDRDGHYYHVKGVNYKNCCTDRFRTLNNKPHSEIENFYQQFVLICQNTDKKTKTGKQEWTMVNTRFHRDLYSPYKVRNKLEWKMKSQDSDGKWRESTWSEKHGPLIYSKWDGYVKYDKFDHDPTECKKMPPLNK